VRRDIILCFRRAELGIRHGWFPLTVQHRVCCLRQRKDTWCEKYWKTRKQRSGDSDSRKTKSSRKASANEDDILGYLRDSYLVEIKDVDRMLFHAGSMKMQRPREGNNDILALKCD
jgi:hypothetical protein